MGPTGKMTPLGRATLAAADDELRGRIRALLTGLTERERAVLMEGVQILGTALAGAPAEEANG